jgi:hypothetical protein
MYNEFLGIWDILCHFCRLYVNLSSGVIFRPFTFITELIFNNCYIRNIIRRLHALIPKPIFVKHISFISPSPTWEHYPCMSCKTLAGVFPVKNCVTFLVSPILTACPDYSKFVDVKGFWRWCIAYRISVFSELPPSPEDGNRSSFRNVVFLLLRTPDDGKGPRTQ